MAERELIEASTEVDASPASVWEVVADLRRMGERSPQCKKMFILRGPVSEGTVTVNLNNRGPLWWPTTSKVTRFERERVLAFHVPINGPTWTYELEPTATGTRLTESRRVKAPGKAISNFLINRFMGGVPAFEAELQRGIEDTLARIKAEAERAPTTA